MLALDKEIFGYTVPINMHHFLGDSFFLRRPRSTLRIGDWRTLWVKFHSDGVEVHLHWLQHPPVYALLPTFWLHWMRG